MQIAIIALGSRGDVQPYVALGQGLQRAGHNVRLLTHENFETLVTPHGLEFRRVKGDVQAVVESPEMRALIEKGNFFAITAQTSKLLKEAMLDWARDGLAACHGSDLIVAGIGGLYIGIAIAEKLSLPFIPAFLVPYTPTSAFPSVLLPPSLHRLGGAFSRASHYLTQQFMWQSSRAAENTAREQVLGLPRAPFFGSFRNHRPNEQPILYGFSPSVIRKPADWGANVHVTGYWFLDEPSGWTPPPTLLEFLQGELPIYIGFGSMGSRNPDATAALVLEALARTGQRAIMLSGWGGLRSDTAPDNIFMIDSIPHSWLFPRVAAVIHHGGAGTTAAGLRAGVPAIITPFFGDQPFWGQVAADLGVAPAPIPRKRLTVERLARAIEVVVNDRAMRERAARLGHQIQAEDGVGKAVAMVETALAPAAAK